MEGEVAGESAVCTKRVVGPAALSSFFLSLFLGLFVCFALFIIYPIYDFSPGICLCPDVG